MLLLQPLDQQVSKVKLTKTQVSIAKRLGVPIEKYAEHVMKEQANG
jgi:hypothetical protein